MLSVLIFLKSALRNLRFKMVNVLKLSLKLIVLLSFLDHLLPIINLKMAKINFKIDTSKMVCPLMLTYLLEAF